MLTDLQRHNLSTLADYLIELPVDYGHFKMRHYNEDVYFSGPDELENPEHGCRTSACAVGHVPYTGIVGWEKQSSWNDVAEYLLGIEAMEDPGTPFNFLFSRAPNPDCPWAAALRIRHYLDTGSVDGFEYPHGLTLEQYQNLRRLAAYLIALPDDYVEFDMSWWTDDFGRRPQDTVCDTVCGTVACAGGHGPRAGIAPLPGESWMEYILRAFTPNQNPQRFIDYIFGSVWAAIDNTPQGAGKRILYALHNEIPDGYNPTVYGS